MAGALVCRLGGAVGPLRGLDAAFGVLVARAELAGATVVARDFQKKCFKGSTRMTANVAAKFVKELAAQCVVESD